MSDDAHTQLLPHHDHHDGSRSPSPYTILNSRHGLMRRLKSHRARGRRVLSSHRKHYFVMVIVVLDVVALLANIFIQLIACELHQLDAPWVQKSREGLANAGLVFSSLFMVELLACLYSFGISYLYTFFHFFDSAVIVLSFVIDAVTHGLTEELGSLVVILRLWRLAKISEEVVMGASERMEVLEQHMEELEHENRHLREQLAEGA